MKYWTFGLTYGSGKYSYSYTDYNSATGYSTKAQNINFSTAEVTGRYYIGTHSIFRSDMLVTKFLILTGFIQGYL